MIGSFAILLSGILYGLSPLVTVFLFSDGLNTVTVSFFRYVLIFPFLIALIIMNKISLKISLDKLLIIFFKLAFFMVATNLLLAGSYHYIASGTSTVLHFVYPIIVIVICVIFYREKISKQLWITILLTSLGIMFFLFTIDLEGLNGIMMAISSSITYAIYILQLEKTRLNRLNPVVLSFYQSLATVVFLVIFSFVVEPINLRINYNELGLFALLAVLTLGALTLFQVGSRIMGAKLSALLSLSEPITSMVVECLFLKEQVNILKVIGAIFIFVSIILITFRKK